MTTVGIFEAKTHLSALIARVAKGEKITITVRGKPVAVLKPVIDDKAESMEAVEALRHWRKNNAPTLGPGLTIRQLIEEGRRY